MKLKERQKLQRLTKEELKTYILELINDDTFWYIVDKIDWKQCMNDDISNIRDKLLDIIKVYNRRKKIDIINKYESRYSSIDINKLKYRYLDILSALYYYFKDVWLFSTDISDDSYWDLRFSIVGFGKDFLISALNDTQVFLDMVNNKNYAENFGYIFNNID